MDTETGASICLLFAPTAPVAVAAVVEGSVSQGHTEQLALLSECTSNVSASVLTDSLKDERGESLENGLKGMRTGSETGLYKIIFTQQSSVKRV